MYLAWSMTYFHINLDPRGKKKNVLPPILIPVGTVWLFFVCLFSFNFFFRLSKMRLQGGMWGIRSRGSTSGGVLQAVIRGWASVFFCLYSDFRCSVLTPVFISVHPLSVWPREVTPLPPGCPQYACCCVRHGLTCFIYNTVVLFSPVCVCVSSALSVHM